MEYKYGSTRDATNGTLRPIRAASVNGAGHAPGGSPIQLVGGHSEWAAAVVSRLRQSGLPAQAVGFDEVRAEATRDQEQSVVYLLRGPDDVPQVRPLIQECLLQKLPHSPMVLVDDNLPAVELLDLAPYLSGQFRWPEQADALVQALEARPARRRPLEPASFPEGSSEARIARRLLSFTPSLVPLVEKLALGAEHDVTVLLTGETGTGKTFLARLIHDFSPRHAERFLIIPCGALAPNLVESEFFGHVKGAFTGADRTKLGKFAAAGNGTLLLDEIDALGLDQQANLLRVVETGEYEPVGSTETQTSTCRLIVASNRNLKEEADKNRFRQDLYYRFNVMSFHLPPLRERVEDIAPLVQGFAARFNTKFKKDLFEISSEAMAALESYPWPGNIRELENAIQHAVLVSQGPLLLARFLPEVILKQGLPAREIPQLAVDTLVHNREVIERTVIQRALANHGNSRARAASELGISRVTLYKKMKKYGLMKESARSLVQ